MSHKYLNFITDEDLTKHIIQTLKNYDSGFQEYDLKRFTQNKIDPIKLLFDKSVYNLSDEEWINYEVYRQQDKSNTNAIGYFHQNIFQYFDYCTVPKKGWDVIYQKDDIEYVEGSFTSQINVEMKNKYNTMNSSSASKIYLKMFNHIQEYPEEVCFLVETIARRSQNEEWAMTIDGKKYSDSRIRRVSIDQFYEVVTGEYDAYFQLCQTLPMMMEDLLQEHEIKLSLDNTILKEIINLNGDKPLDLYDAACLLSYKDYKGFNRLNDDDN